MKDRHGSLHRWECKDELIDFQLVHNKSIPKWFEATLSVRYEKIDKGETETDSPMH
ncbi:hypothetical protein LG329_17635 [Virgibacillus necropolis]|uniref:hypothetical protein n=1 Tax=Virgibacillus necropolis TaxID=163877 RepID=UPI00384B12E7